MIREHAFNTAWYGEPVGIVESSFFELPLDEQSRALAAFSWVELATKNPSRQERARIASAGFFYVDLQLNFRVPLRDDGGDAEVEFATDVPFAIDLADMPPFPTERFRFVPGIDEARLTARYHRWARALVDESPAHSLRVLHDGRVQGWFLARPATPGLELTLAFLHRDATINGHALYAAALGAFARRGERLGWASFSANNTAVHNVYVDHGARFLAPTERYLWIRARA